MELEITRQSACCSDHVLVMLDEDWDLELIHKYSPLELEQLPIEVRGRIFIDLLWALNQI